LVPPFSILTPAGYDKVQGSLTLGGYDTSRFGSKNLTFPMYEDVARRFIVELQAITYIPAGVSTVTTPTTLMSEKLSINIDSTISYIYLPANICEHFESAFGIQWDNVSEIYTINDTMHSLLQSTSPNITFTLSNTAGETIEFVLPYKSLDLSASFPVLPSGTNARNYFPLKRADNDTQYTLGRVFLQEACVLFPPFSILS
jgi:Eukaryotic aspartyl protease